MPMAHFMYFKIGQKAGVPSIWVNRLCGFPRLWRVLGPPEMVSEMVLTFDKAYDMHVSP